MTRNAMNTITTISAITLACGLALPAVAQDTRASTQRSAMNTGEPKTLTVFSFDRADALYGAGIRNPNGETVGAVEDFIIDRGSGHIRYVVVQQGGLLGLGGKEVAIPYEYFRFDPYEDHYVVNLTAEMIERAREFTPDDWVELDGSATWTEQLKSMYRASSEKIRDLFEPDPFADTLDRESAATIEGRIVRVDRAFRETVDRQVVLTLDTGANTTKKVVLGPSWYVMSQPLAPMRGDTVELRVFTADSRSGETYVARSITIDNETLSYRDDAGEPRWVTSSNRINGDSARAHSDPAPLILASDIASRDVSAHGESAGEVQDLFIEHRSGTVPMIVLDPNDNFLGLGDTLRLVPWSVASIGEREVRIDAEQRMIENSVKLPDDPALMNSVAAITPVYIAFNVDVETFTPRDENTRRNAAMLGAWSRNGELAKAYRKSKDETLGGRVAAVKDSDPSFALGACSTIEVRDPEQGAVTVHLAPAWFVKNQPVEFEAGDNVVITARKVTLNGKTFYIASSVSKDGRMMHFWKNDTPVWDAS
ncbi:MAG: PRC-barrel domain-containing protein [Phycisphaerales bacterium]